MGNRTEPEVDIQVVTEDEPNSLTFSLAVPFILSRACRNKCPYCAFHRKDTLAVPYSTIKQAKAARTFGAREGFYISGERPDKHPNVRAILDVWGFASYIDYVYTVCELGFLEGLIPVVELGFLSPLEMKRLSEIVAINQVMLDSVDESKFANIYGKSPGKKLDLRLKQLEWSGRLKFPTITGTIVGIGETVSHRKEMFKAISAIHQEFGTIHEVHLEAFNPHPHTPYASQEAPTRKVMLDTIELAMSMLPSDITVTASMSSVEEAEAYIKAGIRDLGRVFEGKDPYSKQPKLNFDQMQSLADKLELNLVQRFPLKKLFVKNGLYSKKLGQVFDAYRYKIKKDTQDKGK